MAKKITIEDLAGMVQRGFDKTATTEQLEAVRTELKNGIKKLEEKMSNFTEKEEFNKLEHRVDFIENSLAIPKNN